MDSNEARARELLADSLRKHGRPRAADGVLAGTRDDFEEALDAITAALSQQPGVVEVEYRLLRRGEVILATDQLLHDDCTRWEPVTGIGIGMTYDPAAFVPIRRAAAPQPGKEG